MKKMYVFTLKIILLILIMLIGLGITMLIGVLNEKPPEHPLNFQDLEKTALEKAIKSVEDGLPYALNRAHEWRQDAVLTGLQIISVGEDEIYGNNSKMNYIFEFKYIDKNKPGGIITVSIDAYSNSIDFVSVSHDGDDKTRKVSELKDNNLNESIRKVYDLSIKAIGSDNFF